MKNSYLVITAQGKHSPLIFTELTQIAAAQHCSITNARMVKMGTELASIMLLSGSWSAIAKLETSLPKWGQKFDFHITSHRTDAINPPEDVLPYNVQVIGLDSAGILHKVCKFFTDKGININEIYSDNYHPTQSAATMVSLTMSISLPLKVQISEIRDQFHDFCDALNVDAVIEPDKH